MSVFFHSLRWRVQLWHALILGVVIAALCLLAYRLAAEDRADRVDRQLEEFERSFMKRVWEKATASNPEGPPPSMDDIRRHLAELGDGNDFPPFMRGLFDPNSSDSIYLVYWDRDGDIMFRSANAPSSLQRPKPHETENQSRRTLKGHSREIIRRGPRGMIGVVGRDISADTVGLRTLALQISGFGAGLWFFGLVGGWWLSGRAIRPIEHISRTASRISTGSLSERIDIADTDNELGKLSHVLNDTFDRLETALRRQRQFTADASHELRTPLTVILSETSRGLKRDRSQQEYRDILANTRDAAERMRTLVESLLVLARQDDADTPAGQECDLSIVISDAVKLLQPLASQHETTLTSRLGEARVAGDSRALSMVAVNLISNAIHHQESGGKVDVTLSANDGRALLEVADSGPGIASEHLPHLFDRFYRVDPARGAAGGHSGLGLAIVKAIVENHHGSITIESEPGEGSVFRVSLPLLESDRPSAATT